LEDSPNDGLLADTEQNDSAGLQQLSDFIQKDSNEDGTIGNPARIGGGSAIATDGGLVISERARLESARLQSAGLVKGNSRDHYGASEGLNAKSAGDNSGDKRSGDLKSGDSRSKKKDSAKRDKPRNLHRGHGSSSSVSSMGSKGHTSTIELIHKGHGSSNSVNSMGSKASASTTASVRTKMSVGSTASSSSRQSSTSQGYFSFLRKHRAQTPPSSDGEGEDGFRQMTIEDRFTRSKKDSISDDEMNLGVTQTQMLHNLF
jgi:hypothetical protein